MSVSIVELKTHPRDEGSTHRGFQKNQDTLEDNVRKYRKQRCLVTRAKISREGSEMAAFSSVKKRMPSYSWWVHVEC